MTDVGMGSQGSLDVQLVENARAWPMAWADPTPSGGDSGFPRELGEAACSWDGGHVARGTQKWSEPHAKKAGLSFCLSSFHFPSNSFLSHLIEMSLPVGPELHEASQGRSAVACGRVCGGPRLGTSVRLLLASGERCSSGRTQAGLRASWGAEDRLGPGARPGQQGSGSLGRFPFLCHFLSHCVTLLFFH